MTCPTSLVFHSDHSDVLLIELELEGESAFLALLLAVEDLVFNMKYPHINTRSEKLVLRNVSEVNVGQLHRIFGEPSTSKRDT